ncbi:MarR family winged helix-turn-helix transcriptional regulator [Dactylosporangium sp. NPDC050688]|uniref:MarR family winged helix-turn-helix transcriptional regulator n=1 Tax=Dactylosporangium sp. NPDC050688 TaxID=3157217 RepID=UPI0033DB652B
MRGLVERQRTDQDKRMTRVVATAKVGPVLAEINDQVEAHTALFHRQLTEDQRQAVLVVLAFFVGIKAGSPMGESLRASLLSQPAPAQEHPAKRNKAARSSAPARL